MCLKQNEPLTLRPSRSADMEERLSGAWILEYLKYLRCCVGKSHMLIEVNCSSLRLEQSHLTTESTALKDGLKYVL